MNKSLKILHITYDLRDRLKKEKTTAVKNLIDLSNEFGQVKVIDLVRVPFFSEEKVDVVSENHIAIDSFGLPFGVYLIRSLNRAFKSILRNSNIIIQKPDLVHAHKLTYEGYIGYNICKKLSIPLIITLRQTDTMVLNRKPNLRKIYKEILKYSSTIFYLNPYTRVVIEKRLGAEFYNLFVKNKMVLLPNIVERECSSDFHEPIHRKNLLTILRMDKKSVKRKNIKRLLKAFSLINDADLMLNIIGAGDYIYKVEYWVKKFKLEKRVNFLGRIPNQEIDMHYASSLAFLLPSISESFGLVYAEALINGTPILYSKDSLGFDGFFEDVGQAVIPTSIASIKDGINNLVSNNLFYRQNINALKMQKAFNIFSKEYIKDVYSGLLEKLKK